MGGKNSIYYIYLKAVGGKNYIYYIFLKVVGGKNYIYYIYLKVVRGKSKRLYSMARQLSRAMSSEYISLVVIIKDQAQLPNRYYHNTPLEMLTWPMSCLFTSLVA